MKKLVSKITAVALGTAILFSSVGQASAATYTVKSGDTLYKIGQKFNTSYQNIMSSNNLSSTNIKVGQTLQIDGVAKAPVAKTATADNEIVNIANQYLGVRYVFGGYSPKGFDCSGFISYVFNQAGKMKGRSTASGLYSKATKVATPQVGDLVFFSGTYKKGISHVGIYIGNNKMINASGSKVQIENIYGSYWKNYFTGFGRI